MGMSAKANETNVGHQPNFEIAYDNRGPQNGGQKEPKIVVDDDDKEQKSNKNSNLQGDMDMLKVSQQEMSQGSVSNTIRTERSERSGDPTVDNLLTMPLNKTLDKRSNTLRENALEEKESESVSKEPPLKRQHRSITNNLPDDDNDESQAAVKDGKKRSAAEINIEQSDENANAKQIMSSSESAPDSKDQNVDKKKPQTNYGK